uniref:Uncharacterized protein n=1 Tax=Arundo donax TaxID=35708 RepID=A0A0A9BDU8_ARUDO
MKRGEGIFHPTLLTVLKDVAVQHTKTKRDPSREHKKTKRINNTTTKARTRPKNATRTTTPTSREMEVLVSVGGKSGNRKKSPR